MNFEKVWIIVPAYREASVIGAVLDSLAATKYQIVVVDDCSPDTTAEIAERSRAHVCRHCINLGQGAAIQTGIDYALSNGAEALVTFDADGQHSAADIPALLEGLDKHKADVALGSRFTTGGAAHNMGGARRTLLKLATLMTRLSTGLNISDTHNGLRALRAEAARKIRITQNRMAHASEILSLVAQHKLKFVEVPVHISYTDYSTSKGQRASNSFNIIWDSITGMLRR
ncbi:MAG: glycosyltransferase family 2 protein [Oligoflexia bacterium]|nr:glycosyltransferase family 2 protein [Oligoflexia bacterium]